MHALPNNTRLTAHVFLVLALIACTGLLSTIPLITEAQSSGGQCVNNRLVSADGAIGGFCAPTTCPNGAATCPGTALCVDGTISGSSDPATEGQACTPPPAASGALLREGIFGCNASRYSNVGSLSAIGGIYVPVNDAAVTLNTGYLVYKECVLDGVVSRIKESATASLTNQAVRALNSGRNGNAQYLTNRRADLQPKRDAIVINALQDPNIAPICGAFRNRVRTAVARTYMTYRAGPSTDYACTLPGSTAEQEAFVRGTGGFSFDQWFAYMNPANNPYFAAQEISQLIRNGIIEYDSDITDRVNRSGGYFDLTDDNANPLAERILTPGSVISQSFQQVLGSGFRQLESANEIDQVVGSLWGGLTTQLMSDTRGLVGISQSLNGQGSYLDRMAAESSAGVRDAATNAAVGILSVALQTERSYRQAKEAVANALTDAIRRLRDAENQCWTIIIPAVESRAQQQSCTTDPNTGATTCSGGSGARLRIATSTAESQRIITAQIQPLATTTINEIRTSDAALTILNRLVASVGNSSSATNQRAALEQLDTLVANGQLHSAQDAQNAITQRDTALSAINVLVQDTITAWGDSTDPNIGWCNINNPDVVERWFNAWRI